MRFLSDVQRLLVEGDFIARYKYALLLALTDITVELEDDSGQTMNISSSQLAETFIQYYWRQAVPFVPHSDTGASSGIVQPHKQRLLSLLQIRRVARECHPGGGHGGVGEFTQVLFVCHKSFTGAGYSAREEKTMEQTYTTSRITMAGRGVRLLAQAADRIRQLPGVAQVRVEGRGDQIEILFVGQSRHLLRDVHTALRDDACQVARS